MLRRFSIKARLLVLSGVLMAALAGITFYLTTTLTANTRAIARTAELAKLIDVANDVRTAYGEYRYWITDLAVSLLQRSELNANAARERLSQRMQELAGSKPELVAALRADLELFEESAVKAVEQYTDNQRVLGNTFLAEARQHSERIHGRLAALVGELDGEAARARDQVLADAERTTRLALLFVVAAIVLGTATTFFVLRSILRPLDHLVAAMDRLTAGDLDAPIPARARDEIGAMANTLGLFRESLVERTRLSDEADRQRRMIETALATISDGFVLYDANDRLALCNTKFRELYPELDDVTVVGMRYADFLRAVVDRRVVDLGGASPEAWIAERLRQHAEAANSGEYRYKDTWIRINRRRTPDNSAVVVYTDITELKQRQLQIERAMAQAEAATRAKSAFLANMSHELRTPLNAILGYTELMLDGLCGDTLEGMRESLERVHNNGHHLLGLVNDVLDLSKIEAGQLTLSLADYSLGDVVQSVYSAVEPLALEKRLAVEMKIAPDLPPAHGDERKLTQVLLNLVGNAIKFTDEGKVAIAASASDGCLTVAVRDSGPGIAESDQAKIFEEFQQADSSITRKKGGTGLGLTISKRIVELHGGRMWVESTPGRGATFSFTIPTRAPAAS